MNREKNQKSNETVAVEPAADAFENAKNALLEVEELEAVIAPGLMPNHNETFLGL